MVKGLGYHTTRQFNYFRTSLIPMLATVQALLRAFVPGLSFDDVLVLPGLFNSLLPGPVIIPTHWIATAIVPGVLFR